MFFFRESGSKFQLLDLTGGGYPEVVLYFSRATCCNSFSQQFIYELSSGEPRLLSFENLDGILNHTTSEYDSYITTIESQTEPPGFLFVGHYGYDALTQPCNLREYDKYYWKGDRFELAETWFGIDEPGQYDNKEFCQFVIDTAKEQRELNVAVNGYRSISDYKRALSPTGTYVMSGGDTAQMMEAMLLGPWMSRKGSQKMGNLAAKPNQKDLIFVKELLETGKVVPIIDRCYPLREAADAIRYLEEGHAQGKIVITVAT